ncbi:hypothetical protein BJ508DRAFT_417310 [Ascobolus immersus RN42]|uniref:BTB domain-containing protein n=1 Tax=Ascobolus immersus RN42 TaxID=1160509 RepID=A0A3N4HX62_ASCIM|nr:hypothetical protein BJ508DRAFT_417310 [Ascobolus immersus RN42]
MHYEKHSQFVMEDTPVDAVTTKKRKNPTYRFAYPTTDHTYTKSPPVARFANANAILGPRVAVRLASSPASEPFLLHTDLLRKYSRYFSGLLDFPGIESSTKEVMLDLVEPVDVSSAFEYFVEFLYRGTYTIPRRIIGGDHAVLHGKIYVLADRLIAPELKRCALLKMHELLSRSADYELTWDQLAEELIPVVYEGTQEWDCELDDCQTFKANTEPMRELIASYIAQSVSGARARPCMMEAFRKYPELMENMLFHVTDSLGKMNQTRVDYFLAKVV